MSFPNFDHVTAAAALQHQNELVQHANEHRMIRLARRQQHQTWRHKPRPG